MILGRSSADYLFVPSSIFCFQIKSSWKKWFCIQSGELSAPANNDSFSLRLPAASLLESKNRKIAFLFNIIILSTNYDVFQRIRLKHSVAYMTRSNHDKGIHTKTIWSQQQTKPSKLLVIKASYWERFYVAQI